MFSTLIITSDNGLLRVITVNILYTKQAILHSKQAFIVHIT